MHMPVMPPGRGRMVCKASLQDPAGCHQGCQGSCHPRAEELDAASPHHSSSQHCPDSAPARDKAVAANSDWDLSMEECRHLMVGLSPPKAVSGSIRGNRAEVGGTGTSSLCFDIFSAHDLKDHCSRAESDGDVLRKASANMCCSFCLKHRYQEFFVWSHCLAKQLHSC